MTCVETAEAFLAATDPDALHAWAAIDGARLIAQARALDALAPAQQRPLHGLLVAVKDNIDTADLPTAYGSPIYAGHRPAVDAEIVARLRRAGALIAGKTKLTEFAWMHPADTVNPLDPQRTPGGSSSGSAAAVGAGQVAVALGTQTAGSLNRPASYCGAIGYKATFGLIPTAGIKALAPSLDTVGVIGTSIGQIERVAGLGAGNLGGGPDQPATRPHLAFARTPLWDRVEPEARDAIERALAALPDVEEAELPAGFPELIAAQTTIQNAEAAVALAPEYDAHPDLLSDWLRRELQLGAEIPPAAVAAARATAARLGPALAAWLAGYDGVLTPSTAGVPPLGLAFTGDSVFSRAWNLIGAPCISLPLAWTADRLPAGVQLVGAPRTDRRLLRAATTILDQ